MDYLHAIILGIIEGTTEFLPISSTAHLILGAEMLGLIETDFVKSFIIIIQLGAMLPIAWLYLKRYATNWAVHQRVFIAFLPAATMGFILYKFIKQFLLGNIAIMLWALALGGVILIGIEYYIRNYSSENKISHGSIITALSFKQAFIIGCAQAIAVIPGVSRSGATIVSGLVLGLARQTIVEFSFILAVPTIAAATGYDLLKSTSAFSTNQISVLIVGFIVSAIFAQLSISFLLGYVRKHSFIAFGIYRIGIALAFALLLWQ